MTGNGKHTTYIFMVKLGMVYGIVLPTFFLGIHIGYITNLMTKPLGTDRIPQNPLQWEIILIRAVWGCQKTCLGNSANMLI